MHKVIYEQTAEVEDHMWWHESRRDLVRLALSSVPVRRGAALDVGCGTGGMLRVLHEHANRVVGIDISPHAIELARHAHPSADLHLGDANDLAATVAGERFDVIAFFGTLYHEWIKDDAAVLEQAFNLLNPGGVVLVAEPAFTCLRRHLDRMMMGKRRYRLPQVRRLLQNTGLQWLFGTYFNMLFFTPVWLLATWDRWHPRRSTDAPPRQIAVPAGPVNKAMKLVMACERVLVRAFGRVPFGVGVLAIARKPEDAPP